MDCACIEVDYDDCDAGDFTRVKNRKARKEHKCGECHRIINPGETYEYSVIKFQGDIGTHKMCLDCLSVRGAFFCNGCYTEGLWEELAESMRFYEPGDNCLAAAVLKCTPAAREKISDLLEGL